MARETTRRWWLKVTAGMGVALAMTAVAIGQDSFSAAGHATKPSGNGNSLTSSLKRGLDSLANAVTPKPKIKASDDPTSLATKADPGIELYLAVARLYEDDGKPTEAARHYQQALKREPDSLAAHLGFARLLDRMGQPDEARQHYLHAIKAHPQVASTYNNLGLFYQGHGLLNDAGVAFSRAIELQPENPKYRNNIAQLLVSMDRPRDAMEQLLAANRPSVAYYNLGYLLELRGQSQAAAQSFAAALQADPNLAAARDGLARLQQPSNDAGSLATRNDNSVRVSSRPARPAIQPETQSERPAPVQTPRPPAQRTTRVPASAVTSPEPAANTRAATPSPSVPAATMARSSGPVLSQAPAPPVVPAPVVAAAEPARPTANSVAEPAISNWRTWDDAMAGKPSSSADWKSPNDMAPLPPEGTVSRPAPRMADSRSATSMAAPLPPVASQATPAPSITAPAAAPSAPLPPAGATPRVLRHLPPID